MGRREGFFAWIWRFLKKNWKFVFVLLVLLLCFGSYKYGYMKGREGRVVGDRAVSRERDSGVDRARERETREMLTGEVKEVSENLLIIVDRKGEEVEVDTSDKEALVVQGKRGLKYEDIKEGDSVVVYRRISGDKYVVERIRVR